MVEKIVPQWKYTLDVVKNGAMESYNCKEYKCEPNKSKKKKQNLYTSCTGYTGLKLTLYKQVQGMQGLNLTLLNKYRVYVQGQS